MSVRVLRLALAALVFANVLADRLPAAWAQLSDAVVTNKQGLNTQTFPYSFDGTSWNRWYGNQDIGPLVTLSAAGAGAVNGPDQRNFNSRGVVCVFNETVSGGSPSTTFSVQGKDVTSGAYVTLLTSAAITGNGTTAVIVYPGAPSTANTSIGYPLPRTWRVSATVGGTTPAVTATIGCSEID